MVNVCLLHPLLQKREVILHPAHDLFRRGNLGRDVCRRLLREFGPPPDFAAAIALALDLGPQPTRQRLQLVLVLPNQSMQSIDTLTQGSLLFIEGSEHIHLRRHISQAGFDLLHLLPSVPHLRPVLLRLLGKFGELRLDLAQLIFRPVQHALQGV